MASTTQTTSKQEQDLKIALRSPTFAPDEPRETKKPQPYDGLLMREPSPKGDTDDEGRKDDLMYFKLLILRGRRNKDWRATSVFPDDDKDMGEPLPPLRQSN